MDITQIIADAKAHLLAHGEHTPTLYAEFTDEQVAVLIFAELPEGGLARQKEFFLLGRKIGLEYAQHECRALYFINEAWTATYKLGEERTHARIVDDPRRREMLTIQTLDVSSGTMKQELYTAEMLRYEGKFLDLAPTDGPIECDNRVLYAFYAGVCSATMSDDRLGTLIKKYL